MIDFDANGDRKSANYDIINIQGGEEVSIGEWLSATGLATNQNTPVWPGGIRDRPEGYELPTHLRVSM